MGLRSSTRSKTWYHFLVIPPPLPHRNISCQLRQMMHQTHILNVMGNGQASARITCVRTGRPLTVGKDNQQRVVNSKVTFYLSKILSHPGQKKTLTTNYQYTWKRWEKETLGQEEDAKDEGSLGMKSSMGALPRDWQLMLLPRWDATETTLSAQRESARLEEEGRQLQELR